MTHRLALITAAATFVLILFGGLVTNTGSALAVPDWPTTFGYNMFLYPWSQMVGGVFYEHSHRLIGALVGVLTLALAAALWRAGGRLLVAGLVAVAVVAAQGMLGGLRVVLLQQPLAILHGCLAQAFFALLAALAFATSRAAQAAPAAGTFNPSARAHTLGAAALVYGQIVLGALLTHAGFLHLHLIGALAVFTFVPIVTARLRRTNDPVASHVALALLVLLSVQLLVGVGTLATQLTPELMRGGAIPVLAFPVVHRLLGSLILGAVVILAVRVWTPAVRPAASSAGFAGATSWGEVGKGGEAPLPGV